MNDDLDSAVRRGPARRSVVGAAWATPVIFAAAAAPAAAASTTGYDVALDPPQLGGGVTMYNGDFTHIYTVGDPIAWVVANHGTDPAPGGFPMSVTCDNRIWKITSVTGGFDQRVSDLRITKTVVSGNSTTVIFLIPAIIPPNTDSFSGFRVRVAADFLGRYPNDGVSPAPTDTRWEITPPPSDTNPANNSVKYAGYQDEGPAEIWGAVVTRVEQETVHWADGTPLNRPTKVEVTSTGPNATLGGSRISLGTDARMSTDISVTNVKIDGRASTILSKGDSSVWQGAGVQVQFPLSRGLAAGEVLTFDVAYVDAPADAPADVQAGQTNFLPPESELNKPNQRAQDQSYFDN